jgi:HD-GYP domain-containing protein (c-di-GMP phosphodiesterase class II)
MLESKGTPKGRDRSDPSAEKVRDIGQLFVPILAKTLKLTQIYERHNRVIVTPLEELLETMAELSRLEGRWELSLSREYLYVNEIRLRVDISLFVSYHYIQDEFRKRGLGSVTVSKRPGKELLLRFLYAFREAGGIPPGENPCRYLEAKAEQEWEGTISVGPLEEPDLSPAAGPLELKQRSITTFFKAIHFAKGILTSAETRKAVHFRRAKRLVSSLVDILNIDDSLLLGLTNIKNFDEYTFNHSVNVCILSLAVGRRLGLDRKNLSELGLSALFHDIGKLSLPTTLLRKTSELDDDDVDRLKTHPIEGVKKMIELRGLSSSTMKLMNSVFRHHNNVTGGGYPKMQSGEKISLFSRIIRIVDSYDAMTSKRIYRQSHWNNVEAIEELWNLSGRHYDSALLKIFISTVGIFPIGSLVQLSTGEISIVLKNSSHSEGLLRPTVKTLATWEEGKHNPRVVELEKEDNVHILGYFQGSEADSLVTSTLL